ncbi:MAG TPA: DUF5818 domain-containing protein [Candidatus Acidoferrales bacterium]|nr:DUF5818 domain-containing protein [Candidatus Acidoferrales bacterium]
MKKLGLLCSAVIMSAALSFGAGKSQTFTGAISDSMCGASHMMEGSAKDCTLKCVKDGSKFVLVDSSGKVYQLSDQKSPAAFAGANVKVTGTLNGETIEVKSITAAK